jgi:hypothetical protein
MSGRRSALAPASSERASLGRPATDAILVAVRVHQREEPTALLGDTQGGTGEFGTLVEPARELPPVLRSQPPAARYSARTCSGAARPGCDGRYRCAAFRAALN